MVYKTRNRNNIPIYRSAIIFFDNEIMASLCYAKTKGKGRKTKDGRLPEIWNYGFMESRIHEDFAALQLTARRTKDKGQRTTVGR